MEVSGPAEALRMLNANAPGFIKWIADNAKKYHEYQITVEYEDGRKTDLSEKELEIHCKAKKIRFTPLVRGAKGAVRVVVGAILMIAGVYFNNPFVFKIGAALALSGVVELLSPRPKTKNQDGTETLSSYYFDGPVNTELQGNPVPLIYGRVLTGSQAVSASISIDELSVSAVQPTVAETGVWIGESVGASNQAYYEASGPG